MIVLRFGVNEKGPIPELGGGTQQYIARYAIYCPYTKFRKLPYAFLLVKARLIETLG
jgi:hypothetical protein